MRIYRSIYRYAIFGDLFYYDQDRGEIIGGYRQSHIFLTSCPAWEVEELSTVNDFITDKIMEKWQETEDDFYDSLKDDPTTWDVGRRPYDSEEPFHAAFETPEFEAQREALDSGAIVKFGEDDIHFPNEAWLWAFDYQLRELYTLSTREFFVGTKCSILRRFGYMF
ncbi:hypothetical protein G7Y89_g577 [Cudoniella acicularis]|uniref:Uncharacterized protein n=1 Tax=Cudoniella acicularis TaxID=354080 RepID=A0A8H4RZM6_9HELO|nr:hypothetical protein G7Y89_g577 [Cudoniella acicularis]